jgi:hypothetical protein
MTKAASAVAAALLLGSAGLLAMATGATAQTPSPPPAKTVVPLAGEFHPIKLVNHSEACLQPVTSGFRSIVMDVTCDSGNSLQQWATLSTPSGGTHYRFLNTDGWCMSVDEVRDGATVVMDECEVAGGTTVSNAEWNASAKLPDVVTPQTRVGFRNNNFCLNGTTFALPLQIFTCNGSLAERWVVGFN